MAPDRSHRKNHGQGNKLQLEESMGNLVLSAVITEQSQSGDQADVPIVMTHYDKHQSLYEENLGATEGRGELS